jgi:hypothetical protein
MGPIRLVDPRSNDCVRVVNGQRVSGLGIGNLTIVFARVWERCECWEGSDRDEKLDRQARRQLQDALQAFL